MDIPDLLHLQVLMCSFALSDICEIPLHYPLSTWEPSLFPAGLLTSVSVNPVLVCGIAGTTATPSYLVTFDWLSKNQVISKVPTSRVTLRVEVRAWSKSFLLVLLVPSWDREKGEGTESEMTSALLEYFIIWSQKMKSIVASLPPVLWLGL